MCKCGIEFAWELRFFIYNWQDALDNEKEISREAVREFLAKYMPDDTDSFINCDLNQRPCSQKISFYCMHKIDEYSVVDIMTFFANIIAIYSNGISLCVYFRKGISRQMNKKRKCFYEITFPEDIKAVRIISAMRSEPKIMKFCSAFEHFSSLQNYSDTLHQDVLRCIGFILYSRAGVAVSHEPLRIGLNTCHLDRESVILKCMEKAFYYYRKGERIKRIYLVLITLEILWDYPKEDRISNLNCYFADTADPFVSTFEVRMALYAILYSARKLNLFEKYSKEIDYFMPGCPAQLEPRKLVDLARCQIRQNLKVCNLPLPEAVRRLPLAKRLQAFITGKLINITRAPRNVSSQPSVTRSELDSIFYRYIG